jgi:hypothetical protein
MISFKPNCTFPDEVPSGFVNGPNIRSTMQIVWSCIAIIILSTWSILHLNVPPDFREQNAWQLFLQRLYLTSRKALWMIVMFVAPEGWTSLCALKMFTARHNNKILKDLAKEQRVPWSHTHTVFADMGGFAICFSDREVYPTPEHDPVLLDDFQNSVSTNYRRVKEGKISQIMKSLRRESDFVKRFELKQRLFFGWFGQLQWKQHEKHVKIAHSIKEKLSEKDNVAGWKLQNLAALSGDIWVLDSAQLIAAVEGGIVNLPNITKKELDDRSKSDALVKFLAILQVLWLVIQLAARKYYGLVSTPFEVGTVALSASAVILYIIEWHKPKDVHAPIYIRANKLDGSQEAEDRFKNTFYDVFETAPYPVVPFSIIPTKVYHVPNCVFHWTPKDHGDHFKVWVQGGFITGITILSFGGIHLFAWNFQFPTGVEQMLWRICAIGAILLPIPVAIAHSPFTSQRVNDMSSFTIRLMESIQIPFAVFYALARLFLIVESVRSLYFLPAEAFVSTWSANFPHWG